MALGGWKHELLELMKAGCTDTTTFQNIYFQDGTSTDSHWQKHSKFLFHMLGKRAKSVLGTYMKPPWRYSALTDPGLAESVQATMLHEWNLILDAELKASQGDDICILQSMHFLKSSFVRLHFLAAEKDSLVPNLHHSNSDAALLSKVATNHIGDTVVVENTHQKCKDLLRQARHDTSSRLSKFHSVITSNVFAGRSLPHLKVSDMDKARSGASKRHLGSVVKSTHPNSHQMSKEFQEVMRYKASMPGFTWPSTSQDSLFNEVGSLELLLQLGAGTSPETLGPPTVTCLIGQPGDLVANRVASVLLVVVAVGQHAFLGWEAQVLPGNGDDFMQAAMCTSPAALQWHFMLNLDDWICVPSKHVCLNRYGPLVFEKTGAPIPLLLARIQAGLQLTIRQCQAVLKHYKVTTTSQMRKRDYFWAIFGIFLTTDQEKDSAMERSGIEKADTGDGDDAQQELDSDYEELLEQLEEVNMGDADLKSEKAKVKKMKQKQNIDDILLDMPRGGRGRGRFRAGKGKGRNPLSEVLQPSEEANDAVNADKKDENTAGVAGTAEPLEQASASGAALYENLGESFFGDNIGDPVQPSAPSSGPAFADTMELGDLPASAGGGAGPVDPPSSGPSLADTMELGEPPTSAGDGAGPVGPPASGPSLADTMELPPASAGDGAGPVDPGDGAHALVPAEPGEEETVKRKKGSCFKHYESPHHLLDPLAPPMTKLSLNCTDHRFTISFRQQATCAEWKLPQWSKKTFSKSFSADTWQEALEEVHAYAWNKWKFASKEKDFQLKKSEKIQETKDISKKTRDELQEWIDQLPAKRKQGKTE